MVKGQKEKRDQFPTIITCPNEVSQIPSFRIYNISGSFESPLDSYFFQWGLWSMLGYHREVRSTMC